MTEPVSKKSGTEFRRSRDLRNEEFNGVLDKTKKIVSFFQPKKPTDVGQVVDSLEHTFSYGDANDNLNDEESDLSASITQLEIGIFV